MKKTLIALTVAALASTSASALTVYSENGATVDVTGAVKMVLQKETNQKAKINKKDAKLGIKAKYDFGTDAYALAAYEYSFLEPKVKKAYIGVGSASAGQLTFGLQNTFADGVGQSTFDNAFGALSRFIPGDSDDMISYRYTGLENWSFGADYILKKDVSQADMDKAVKDVNDQIATGDISDLFGKAFKLATLGDDFVSVGAQYDANNLTAGFAYAHAEETNLVDAGFAYKLDDVKLGLDLGYSKVGDLKGFYVSPGVKVSLGDAAVYGTYSYTKFKFDDVSTKLHGFNLGAEYTLAKNALIFVEGNYIKVKDKDSVKAIGVGMKVEW
ncbi:porin [Pasteurella skyensis]|uniref:Porin n=1 Tax=Phocoenobacter skyensis TaxID=97481 RepID=A0AAJ6N9I0_9PAST|nr:porin [Pasteurella skyensis]MDP8162239.1 porin [Pasteurella skyensis]MDP8172703.1 porin [Pasteurella skyensis]MDP8176865.1 porin [Pasteurella skyensis]MDP8179203.1 porin [Pasteurella skyensis]MDP8183342.1 porin [Pasteurella skyensis]